MASVEAEATKTLQLVNGSPDSEHTSSERSAVPEGCWPLKLETVSGTIPVPESLSGRFFERRRQRVPVERECRRLGLQSNFMQARAAALGKVFRLFGCIAPCNACTLPVLNKCGVLNLIAVLMVHAGCSTLKLAKCESTD